MEKNRFDEADSDEFWDIAKLLPQKQRAGTQVAPARTYPRASEPSLHTREVCFAPPSDSDGGERDAGRLTVLSSACEVTEECYTPAFNRLITSVKIQHRTGGVSFYRRFREDAVRYHSMTPPGTAEYVPFFSYVPQYVQLSDEQRAYYLYFREAVRRGEAVKCDEAYFRLYAYEILNLPDLIPKEEGLLLLCRLFCFYCRQIPKICKYMTGWLIDYCLLYRLPCPTGALHGVMDAVMQNTRFHEFFLYDIDALPDDCVAALQALTTDYVRPIQKTNAEHEAFLSQHTAGAMRLVLKKLLKQYGTLSNGHTAHLAFDAFSGTVTAHNIRARIEVDYHPFSVTGEFGKIVKDALKYAENRLRACIGIRTRLRGVMPPPDIAAIIDDYVRESCPKREPPPPPRPAYESLYEPSERGISWESIADIESASWDVTRRLTDEETNESEEPCDTADIFVQESAAEATDGCHMEQESGGEGGLSVASLAYLKASLRDMHEARLAASAHGVSENACVEEINAAFLDAYGDILLTDEGAGYRILADYEAEVVSWIKELNG